MISALNHLTTELLLHHLWWLPSNFIHNHPFVFLKGFYEVFSVHLSYSVLAVVGG